MHIVIQHAISDPARWNQSVQGIMSLIQQGRLPAGVKPLQYLPSVDGRRADCVWESDSLEVLKQFVDRETAGARNEYFQVKADAAVGLPTVPPVLPAA